MIGRAVRKPAAARRAGRVAGLRARDGTGPETAHGPAGRLNSAGYREGGGEEAERKASPRCPLAAAARQGRGSPANRESSPPRWPAPPGHAVAWWAGKRSGTSPQRPRSSSPEAKSRGLRPPPEASTGSGNRTERRRAGPRAAEPASRGRTGAPGALCAAETERSRCRCSVCPSIAWLFYFRPRFGRRAHPFGGFMARRGVGPIPTHSSPSAQRHHLEGCGLRGRNAMQLLTRRIFPEPTMIHRSGRFLTILVLASLLAAGAWPVLAAACPHAHRGCDMMMATHPPCGSSQWRAAASCCSSQAPAPQPQAKVALPGPVLAAHPTASLPPDRSPAEALTSDPAPILRTPRTPLFLLYADLLI